MNYLALMKLLCLVDREALIRFGRPVTGDPVVAMKHGPVLSRVYDLVSRKKQELAESEWHKFIPRPNAFVYTVRFSGVPEVGEDTIEAIAEEAEADRSMEAALARVR